MHLLVRRTAVVASNHRPAGLWYLLIGCLALLGVSAANVAAQEPKAPAPVDETLLCKDNQPIMITYIGGTRGKESTPVILLHEQGKNRRDLEKLGLSLQQLIGAAVVIPDLRGHGDSPIKTPQGKLVDNATFRRDDFLKMLQDLNAVKEFLLKKNNANELNIDKLAVVGVQMGATIGAVWGQEDWLAKLYLQGKSGQFVKLVVLVSPQLNYKGLNMPQLASVPPREPMVGFYNKEVSAMVICGGNDATAKREATATAAIFEKRDKSQLDQANLATCTVFKSFEETKLQATALIGEASLQLDQKIAAFIKLRCVDQPYAWEIRKNELGQPFK